MILTYYFDNIHIRKFFNLTHLQVNNVEIKLYNKKNFFSLFDVIEIMQKKNLNKTEEIIIIIIHNKRKKTICWLCVIVCVWS